MWKAIVKAFLFPPLLLALFLIPVAFLLLIYAFLGTHIWIAYIAYVLSAYTLTVWCARVPHIITGIKAFKAENKLAQKWFGDVRFRMRTSLFISLLCNIAYAVLQLWIGVYHRSFWFGSIALYYTLLAIMRFFLVRYLGRYVPGENRQNEWHIYRICGWVLLVMNIALTLMVFFMVYWNRTFHHHEITAITMAAYTFTSFTMAIIDIVKYRKYNNPVYTASKTTGLAAACVSMLTLTSTMLTAFGEAGTEHMRRLMSGLVGGGVSFIIIVMALYMIFTRKKKENT